MVIRNISLGFLILFSLFIAACTSHAPLVSNTSNNNTAAPFNDTVNKTSQLNPVKEVKAQGCKFTQNISCYNYKLQVWPDGSSAIVKFTLLNNLNVTAWVKKVTIQEVNDCPKKGCDSCVQYSNALWSKNQEFLASINALNCTPKDTSINTEYNITVDYTVTDRGVVFEKTAMGNLIVKPIISSVR